MKEEIENWSMDILRYFCDIKEFNLPPEASREEILEKIRNGKESLIHRIIVPWSFINDPLSEIYQSRLLMYLFRSSVSSLKQLKTIRSV